MKEKEKYQQLTEYERQLQEQGLKLDEQRQELLMMEEGLFVLLGKLKGFIDPEMQQIRN